MKFFDWIDDFIRFLTKLWDNGTYFYILMVGFVLLMVVFFASMFIIIKGDFIKGDQEQIPQEKQDILNQAPQYCSNKGFNSWKWINETEFTFTCFNTTTEQPTIDNYFRN